MHPFVIYICFEWGVNCRKKFETIFKLLELILMDSRNIKDFTLINEQSCLKIEYVLA